MPGVRACGLRRLGGDRAQHNGRRDCKKRARRGHVPVMRVDELAQRRFTHLYEQHYWSVLRFLLRRLGEEPRSRDLTAEVFVVAWRRLDELPDPVLPWLYGVARRVLANEYRSQGRQDRLPEGLAGGAAGEGEGHCP